MKTLVIGGTGFTGSHLVPILQRADPNGLVATASRTSKTYPVDLTDSESVHAIVQDKAWDRVVCLAACMRHPERETFVQTNIRGMEYLMSALQNAHFSGRLLVAGSSAVYGELNPWTPDALGEQETHAPTQPVSTYGETLLEREFILHKETAGQPFSTVMTRTFNLIGPGLPNPFAFARFAERTHRFLDGKVDAVEVGSLEAIRDFIDVRDACEAYLRLLELPMAPGDRLTCNISSGVGRATGDFFPIVEHITGKTIPTRVNPDWSNPREVRIQVGDSARIHRLTGWVPQISFEQSVTDLFSEYGTSPSP